MAANRVFVQAGAIDRFVSLLKSRISNLKLGHGLDPVTTFGPLVTAKGAERCVTLVADAQYHGAKILSGGKRVGQGFHFEPTLLIDVGTEAKVHREEIFAPICSLYTFETEAEVSRPALGWRVRPR